MAKRPAKDTSDEKAKREGKYAAENGIPFGHCPYTELGSPQRRVWQDTWQAYHFVIGRKLKKNADL